MRPFDEKYLIVTGGAGFIGSALIRHLNDQGFEKIIVVDDLGTDEKWKNLLGKKLADVVGVQQLFPWLERHPTEVSSFVHLGANSSTTERNADLLLENNYRYTKRLADFACANNVRFVYASSAATYGDGSLGFSDDENKLETLRPLNMYGFSKQLFDLYAKQRGYLKSIVGLKYFNVFGPNEWHKGRMSSVVLKFVDQIENRGFVELFESSEPERFSDGEQIRDFLYVKDAVKMTAAFLENEVGGIFNVGSGKEQTWKEIASATFTSMGLKPDIRFIPMPRDLIGKYQNYTCAKMDKTRQAIGEKAKTEELHKAVSDYVQNHLLKETPW